MTEREHEVSDEYAVGGSPEVDLSAFLHHRVPDAVGHIMNVVANAR